MLGDQVHTDLEVESLGNCIPFQTSWGRQRFQDGLLQCTDDKKQIKRKQLHLLALSTESTARGSIQASIAGIQTKVVDECLEPKDSRIQELVHQVLWKPESFGAFLNSNPAVLNVLISWKTIVLLTIKSSLYYTGFVVPYFIQKYIHQDNSLTSSMYLEHIRSVIRKQITIPTFLRSRHPEDRIGFLFESLFIGLTLAMFISSLWNQIHASLHLRRIWFDIEDRGREIHRTQMVGKSLMEILKSLPLKKQRALRSVIEEGEHALDTCRTGYDNVSTFGSVWNKKEGMQKLRSWIGYVDVITSIASLPKICYPIVSNEVCLQLRNVRHPAISVCVPNNFSSSAHTIVTGPNRGGKSTFCKTVGLAILTAQSWGFAWAEKMIWSPFSKICTVLEPCGKLGIQSTFEAEIEFAKSVLAEKGKPMFVMMDEIFHSTNAKDGFAASKVFLDQLYANKDTISIISTHYTELASHFTQASTKMLLTNTTENGMLSYTYSLVDGISDKSSVMEILKERGLLQEMRLYDVRNIAS